MAATEPGKPAPLYVQFDGEEIEGTRYALGDQVKEGAHPGIIAVLSAQGRVSATKPSAIVVPAIVTDKPVAAMTRPELESSALAIAAARMGDASDDALRDAIQRHRDEVGTDDDGTDDGEGAAYADLKDRPLGSLKTAELVTVAEAEGVDLASAKTNADRVSAIETARTAKSGS